MSFFKKDSKFRPFLEVLEKQTKKIRKLIFANDADFGFENENEININVFGRQNISGSFHLSGTMDINSSGTFRATDIVVSRSGSFGSNVSVEGIFLVKGDITGSDDLVIGDDAVISGTLRSGGQICYYPFSYATTAATRIYVPFYGTTESSNLDAIQSRICAAHNGRALGLVLYTNNSLSTTTVTFHKNINVIASTSDTFGMVASSSHYFDLTSVSIANQFSQGDLLHIGIDPLTAPDEITGVFIVQYNNIGI